MIRKLNEVLAVSFTCDSSIEVGDRVEVLTDGKVTKIATRGSSHYVGNVCKHLAGATTCTVETPFRIYRNDAVAGAACPVGPFVYGADNKVYSVTAGSAATVTSANASTYAIVAGTSDALKVTVGANGTAETITLTAGAARTAAQIVGEINAAATTFYAEETADHKVKLIAKQIGACLTIGAVTHDCYTVLGLTAASVDGTYPSTLPPAINGVVTVSCDAGNKTVTLLEY